MAFFKPFKGGIGYAGPGIGGASNQGGIGYLGLTPPAPGLGAYGDEIDADTPVAWWRLDELSGTTAADVTTVHDGVYVNTPILGEYGLISEGLVHRSVLLNDVAAQEHVTVLDSDDFSFTDDVSDSPFSVEAWIYVTSLANHAPIIAKTGNGAGAGNEWLFQVRTDGMLEVALYGDVTTDNHQWETAASTISTGVLYHVVATYNGTTNSGKIYIDSVDTGVSYSDAGTYSSMINTPSPLTVGARFPGQTGQTYFEGYIDEPAVYNYELSGARVLAHYNAGTAAAPFATTTWDPANKDTTLALSEGNLRAVQGSGDVGGVMVAHSYSTHKFYCELTNLNSAASHLNEIIIGICKDDIDVTSGVRLGDSNTYKSDDGDLYLGVTLDQSLAGLWGQNDVLSVLIQTDEKYVQFWRNGTPYGTILSYTWDNPTALWISAAGGSSDPRMDIKANFGATAFVYSVPVGWTPGLPAL